MGVSVNLPVLVLPALFVLGFLICWWWANRRRRVQSQQLDALRSDRRRLAQKLLLARDRLIVRRDLGRDSKTTASVDDFIGNVESILDAIHDELYRRAETLRDERIQDVADLSELETLFKDGYDGFARMDASLIDDKKYEHIKKNLSLTSRCMPLDTPDKVIVGKAY